MRRTVTGRGVGGRRRRVSGVGPAVRAVPAFPAVFVTVVVTVLVAVLVAAATGAARARGGTGPTDVGGGLGRGTPGSACAAVLADVRTASGSPAEEAAPEGWTLVWSDDFDGPAVDRGRWNVRDGTANANEASHLLRRNVELCDGYLAVTARREQVGGRRFTSGYLDTIGTASFEVGSRVEVRAMVPTDEGTSQGMWPAFWLRSDQHGGEIDVAEFYGSPHPPAEGAHLSVQHVVHEDTHGGQGRSGATHVLPDGARPGEGFHTYAAEVLEDGVRFEVDGRTTHVVDAQEHPWVRGILTGTWNIRLNLQVGRGGSWATAPTAATVLPASFVVDHVRVYRPS